MVPEPVREEGAEQSRSRSGRGQQGTARAAGESHVFALGGRSPPIPHRYPRASSVALDLHRLVDSGAASYRAHISLRQGASGARTSRPEHSATALGDGLTFVCIAGRHVGPCAGGKVSPASGPG